MPVTRIMWRPGRGYDVHVVRNSVESRPLINDLEIQIDDDDPIPATSPPSGVTVRFEARFSNTPANPRKVQVNPTTGSVRAEAPPPPDPQLQNFVLTAVVHDDAANKDFRAVVRVHVHKELVKIWLTPQVLSARLGVPRSDGYHFGVLALFDGDSVGEISNWPGLAWRSAAPGRVAVDTDGLEVQSPGADLVEVSLELDPALYTGPRPPPATAKVRRLEGWTSAAMSVRVEPVTAGRRPGPARPVDRAINVLFLPEGFPPEERQHFEAIVKKIVYNLRTMRTVKPLSDLGARINYWSAFIPFQHPAGPQPPGLTVLSQCVFDPGTLQRKLDDLLDSMRPPTAAPGAMTLANLVYEVGLPETELAARPGGVPTPDEMRGEWTTLYDTDSQGVGFTEQRVPNKLYFEWIGLMGPRLIDEVDTFFGFALGGRPRLEQDALHFDDEYRAPLVMFHNPRRAARKHFDEFLGQLSVGRTSKDTIGSGEIWTAEGQDRGLVCVIGRTRCGRARFSFQDGNVFLPVGDAASHVLKVVAGRVELAPLTSGQLPSVESRKFDYALTTAHELGHAFGLGDEYGESAELTPELEALGISDMVSDEGNLQLRSSLRAAFGVGLSPALVRDQLRWRWPRARAGAVLFRKPDPENAPLTSGTILTLTLLPGHGRHFRDGDVVFLRRRPLAQQTHLIPWLQIEGPPTGDQVRARVLITIPLNSALFVGEDDRNVDQRSSVLLAAVLRSGDKIDPNTGIPRFLPLVAPAIVEHLAASRGPLDAPAANPLAACDPEAQERRGRKSPFTVPKNLPQGLLTRLPADIADNLRKKKFLILGLYQGGAGFYCGVFHPAGVCLMNEESRHRRGKHRFCQVCKYLLVDRIDPTMHGLVDADYGRLDYPEPSP